MTLQRRRRSIVDTLAHNRWSFVYRVYAGRDTDNMSEFALNLNTTHLPHSGTGHLFTWRGGGIVLIGTHENGRWVLARGWLQADRLQHVRRWTFDQPITFSRQVHRLITDANGSAAHAREEGLVALSWAESASA